MDSLVPTPPITVDEGGDLEVYPDVESACADLEVYDLHRYDLFDSRGQLLEVNTSGYTVTGMRSIEGRGPEPEDLTNRLKRYIREVGPTRVGLPDYGTASLDELLQVLLRFFASGPTYERGLSAWFDGIWRVVRGR